MEDGGRSNPHEEGTRNQSRCIGVLECATAVSKAQHLTLCCPTLDRARQTSTDEKSSGKRGIQSRAASFLCMKSTKESRM
eukprot:3041049-Rhodomonas_salina.1